MEQITIAGQVFNVPIRYGEGYTLSESEGAKLQRVYVDALRNNLTPTVKKALEDGESFETVQARIDHYAENFTFQRRNGIQSQDPVLAEAMDIAKKRIREELRWRGKKLKDVDGRRIMKAAKKLVQNTPAIVKLAQKRVTETSAIAAMDLKSVVADL